MTAPNCNYPTQLASRAPAPMVPPSASNGGSMAGHWQKTPIAQAVRRNGGAAHHPAISASAHPRRLLRLRRSCQGGKCGTIFSLGVRLDGIFCASLAPCRHNCRMRGRRDYFRPCFRLSNTSIFPPVVYPVPIVPRSVNPVLPARFSCGHPTLFSSFAQLPDLESLPPDAPFSTTCSLLPQGIFRFHHYEYQTYQHSLKLSSSLPAPFSFS